MASYNVLASIRSAISSLTSGLSSETNTRAQADIQLQGQIDGLGTGDESLQEQVTQLREDVDFMLPAFGVTPLGARPLGE